MYNKFESEKEISLIEKAYRGHCGEDYDKTYGDFTV